MAQHLSIIIYILKKGFTENDFLRSWQINEGVMSRDEALNKTLNDNQPNFRGIKDYLNLVGLDYKETIDTISNIPSNLDWN